MSGFSLLPLVAGSRSSAMAHRVFGFPLQIRSCHFYYGDYCQLDLLSLFDGYGLGNTLGPVLFDRASRFQGRRSG